MGVAGLRHLPHVRRGHLQPKDVIQGVGQERPHGLELNQLQMVQFGVLETALDKGVNGFPREREREKLHFPTELLHFLKMHGQCGKSEFLPC